MRPVRGALVAGTLGDEEVPERPERQLPLGGGPTGHTRFPTPNRMPLVWKHHIMRAGETTIHTRGDVVSLVILDTAS